VNAYDYIAVGTSEHFSLSEWAEPDILKDVDVKVIQALDRLRERAGIALHPSQLADGWARFKGSKTSRHYAVGRLSDAADIFPARQVLDCWIAAMEDPYWGGIGLYLDTNRNKLQPQPMLHLDGRNGDRVFWVRNARGRYVYQHKHQAQFWALIDQVRRAQ